MIVNGKKKACDSPCPLREGEDAGFFCVIRVQFAIFPYLCTLKRKRIWYVREFGHHPDLQGEREHREDYPLRLQPAHGVRYLDYRR